MFVLVLPHAVAKAGAEARLDPGNVRLVSVVVVVEQFTVQVEARTGQHFQMPQEICIVIHGTGPVAIAWAKGAVGMQKPYCRQRKPLVEAGDGPRHGFHADSSAEVLNDAPLRKVRRRERPQRDSLPTKNLVLALDVSAECFPIQNPRQPIRRHSRPWLGQGLCKPAFHPTPYRSQVGHELHVTESVGEKRQEGRSLGLAEVDDVLRREDHDSRSAFADFVCQSLQDCRTLRHDLLSINAQFVVGMVELRLIAEGSN